MLTTSEKHHVHSRLLPAMSRVFVASTWYVTEGMPKQGRLYCKCRELVSGDRAEQLAFKALQEVEC